MTHEPVLCAEVVAALNIQPDGCYMDCTYGRGGHSRAILQRLGAGGCLWALDRDPEAVAHARSTLGADPRVRIAQRPFSRMADCGASPLDGVLMDLGVSLPQLLDMKRGFSWNSDALVDMRMDPGSGESATVWLSHVSARELERVLREYGEERFAAPIARAIVADRPRDGWRASALAARIARSVPRRRGRLHPATRSFQAIRIRINDELSELAAALESVVSCLAEHGRIAVISFHSLEDRLVKRFFRMAAEQGRLRCMGALIRPQDAEVRRNRRARSARLRVAEKCGAA